MSKKIRYSLDADAEEFNFLLIGISCALDQYSVVTILNKQLNIDLGLQSIVPYHLKGNNTFSYNMYACEVPELYLEFNLISNLSNFESDIIDSASNDLFATQAVEERARLIKELPKTDYFLIVKGESLELYEYKVVEALKGVADFTQIQQIQVDELKSGSNLIF